MRRLKLPSIARSQIRFEARTDDPNRATARSVDKWWAILFADTVAVVCRSQWKAGPKWFQPSKVLIYILAATFWSQTTKSDWWLLLFNNDTNHNLPGKFCHKEIEFYSNLNKLQHQLGISLNEISKCDCWMLLWICKPDTPVFISIHRISTIIYHHWQVLELLELATNSYVANSFLPTHFHLAFAPKIFSIFIFFKMPKNQIAVRIDRIRENICLFNHKTLKFKTKVKIC